ncbi:MAG: trigger factor [Spirosomataceae bacterium]
MNVTLEKSSATNASLKVALSPADYQSKVDKKIKEYSQKAVMKGFRPGKVPTGLVQKLYGKGILVEEINHMLSHALNDYIRNNKLPVVGDPLPSQSQNEIDFDTQKEFEFEYDLGLASEFNIDFDSLPAVTSYSIQATDEEINKTIEDLKVRFGEHNHVEEVALGDLVYGHLIQGDFNEKTGIPTKQVTDEALKVLVGAKKGDTVVVDIQKLFKEERSLELATSKKGDELAALQGEFHFEIEDITRQQEAELNQEFFDKVLGQGKASSEEDFRAQLATIIQENYNREADYVLKDDLQKMLLDNINIELPDAFLKRWLLVANEGKFTEEEIEKDYNAFASDLRWTLIRNRIAESADVNVAKEEIDATAEAMIRSQFGIYGGEDNGMEDIIKRVAQNYLKEKDGKNYMNIFNRVYVNKVMEVIQQNAKVEVKAIEVDEFKKLSGVGAEEHDHDHDHHHDH